MFARMAFFSVLLMGCSADATGVAEDDLQAKADEEWFYNGPMPVLEQPHITVSLAGNTARLSGLLPLNATAPNLPNVLTSIENGRTRIDAVYPIATARAGKSNSSPGIYSFYYAMPYRPNGQAWTPEEGNHFVTWGGFPFIAYNNGIAFHGPITSTTASGVNVWLLKARRVGRLQPNERRARDRADARDRHRHEEGVPAERELRPEDDREGASHQRLRPVRRQMDRRRLSDGRRRDAPGEDLRRRERRDVRLVDRLGVSPNGKDLPPSMKWEGGVSGQYYVFAEHAIQNAVCSVGKADLPKLRAWITQRGGEVPADLRRKPAT